VVASDPLSLDMMSYIGSTPKCTAPPQVRLGEKEALDSTLRFFEDRASRLSDLEYYQERRLKGLGLMDDNGGSTYDDFFKDGVA